MTVYLHIGSHKTGTTSIQVFLSENRKAFMEAGLAYLTYGPKAPAANMLINKIASQDPNMVKKVWRVLAKQRENAEHCLISAENLFATSPNMLKTALHAELVRPGEDVKIICYLRRQDEYLESLFLQRLRNGRTRQSLEKFIQSRISLGRGRYTKTLDLWKTAFPEAEILVRVYQRNKLIGQDAIEDFLHLIGMEKLKALQATPQEANPRANRDLYDLLQLVAQNTKYDVAKVNAQLVNADLPHTGAGRNLLSDEQRKEIFNHFKDENIKLAENYLNQDTPPFDPPHSPANNHSSFSCEQLELIGKLLSALP